MKLIQSLTIAGIFALGACNTEPEKTDPEDDPAVDEVADEAARVDQGDGDSGDGSDDAAGATLEKQSSVVSGDGPVARPVMYGDDPQLDACGGVGEVSGLKPGGEGFLSVRALPSTNGEETDRLKNGQKIYFCDATKDQAWIGIVYDKSGSKDCGTGSPIPEYVAYTGPCESGWVSARFVTRIAG